MSLKACIKNFAKSWILPPMVLYFLRDWLFPFVTGRHFSTLKKFEKKSRRLFVLATGPSLNKDYEKYRSDIIQDDTLVMNMFAVSDLFESISPRAYLLADPVYFRQLDCLSDAYKEKMVALRNAMLKKVAWPMTLVVPDFAKGSELLLFLSDNANITYVYYNSRPECGGNIGLWLFKREKVSPPAQTVATVAAGIGIALRYEEVWMLGIDSSMHTMMRVDQVTNEMFLENSHFYGTKREKCYRGGEVGQPYTVSYFLGCVARMFEGYERIRRMADYTGVRVVNASSFSWVDSLERV